MQEKLHASHVSKTDDGFANQQRRQSLQDTILAKEVTVTNYENGHPYVSKTEIGQGLID